MDAPQYEHAGRRRTPLIACLCVTLPEVHSLGAGQPGMQLAAVRHAEHLQRSPFEAVRICTVLVGNCQDSVGEALAGGIHLCRVTLEVVSDLGPPGVKCPEDDFQRLWAVARGRYERARLHGASLCDRTAGTVPGS